MMKKAALIIAMLCASPSFAAQSGLGIGGRLLDHRHTTYGDGGILQGLSPVGPFLINTNNAGNINISTSLAGTIFLWKPNTANFTAGQFTTSQGAYSVNLGSYTFNLGAENKAQAHYSGALGYGNTINGFRYNAYAFGNYLTNTANNSLVIGNGYNLYPYSVSNSTGTTKIYAGRTEPELSAGATGIEISTLVVRGYISVNGGIIARSSITASGDLYFNGSNSTIWPSSNFLYIEPATNIVNVVRIKGSTTYAPRLEINNAANVAQVIKLNGGGDSYINTGYGLGVGTTTPTAALHVVGLVEYADNAAALAGGLTTGAFYRTGDNLKVVH